MKFMTRRTDGGPEATVTGYWLAEIKALFSIVLLRFDGKSREAFHTHAFNSISWVLRGGLTENFLDGKDRPHRPSWVPIITLRGDFHKVDSDGVTWVLSFRGPWSRTWREYHPNSAEFITLSDGRKVVDRSGAI